MLNWVPAEGRSVCVGRVGLNARECKIRNQEPVMEFLKGMRACKF